jgi:putative isomerase
MLRRALSLACLAALGALPARAQSQPRSSEYAAVQDRLARGWNTWDLYSVAAQVLMPEAFTLRVGLKANTALDKDAFLADAEIGRFGKDAEEVFPGPHAWDGGYTELRLTWRGSQVLIQSAAEGRDLVVLVTPLPGKGPAPAVVFSGGVLWNRPGSVQKRGGTIEFEGPAGRITAYCTGAERPTLALPVRTPYFCVNLEGPVGLSTGRARPVAEIAAMLAARRPPGGTVAGAIESVLGWDTTYDPYKARVISPVSRIWSLNWGGYVLFDWDTFFAASLAAVGDRDLAYANALEVLNEETEDGFVPNYARSDGWKSFDRSEPPVGAVTVLGLYRKFGDLWLVRDAFGPLLRWNRWWERRRTVDGYLVLGTDRDTRIVNPDDPSVGTRQGAVYESGLDNSPMYDGAPFHAATGRLAVADVGLMGLYAADCSALAEMARLLGKGAEEKELAGRAERTRAKLQSLWDEASGIYLSRNLDTGEAIRRLSPVNFYPMLGSVPTPAQARRMVREHLMNPAEFWGEWVIPSISRSDPAFGDQNYWRGRIWGPMNYLVYLGLRNYDEPAARRELASKSVALFAREWSLKGHVHENYNAVTGLGDDVTSSDRYYHWGALLGLLGILENGDKAALPGP